MGSDGKLGRRLRRLRISAGLTQHDLAAPEYTHAYVSQIESGRRDPSPAALQHFARKLNIGVEELQTGRPPDLDERLRLELHEARSAAAAGQLDGAAASYEHVQKQAQRYALPRLVAKALEGRAWCSELRGDLDDAISLYEQSESAVARDPITTRVDAIAGRARCLQKRGDTRTSVYILEQAMEALERQKLSDPGALMRLHTSLVAAYFERGAYERAATSADEALRLGPRTNDPERLANMYLNIARVFLDQEAHEEAHDALTKAEDLFRELDMKANVAGCHHSRGYVLSRQGRLEEAEEELERAREVFAAIEMPTYLARTLIELARIKRLRGDSAGAEETLERALEIIGDKDVIDVADARRELALCRRERDWAQARELLTSAAEIFERAEELTAYAATRRLLGDLLLEHDDVEGAARAFRDGIVAVEERL